MIASFAGAVGVFGAIEPTVRSIEPVDVAAEYYPGARPFKNAEKLHFFTSAKYNGGVVLQFYAASDGKASAGETIGLNPRMTGTNELIVDMKTEFDKVHAQGRHLNHSPTEWYHFCKLWVDTAGNIKTLSATGEFLQTAAEALRLDVETGNDLHICRAEKPGERPYITVRNPSDQSLHWTATFTVSDIFGRQYAIPFDRTVSAGETVRVDFPWGAGQLPPAKGVWHVRAEIDGDDGSHDMRQTSFAYIDLHEKTPDMPNTKFRFGIHYHGTMYLPGQTNITLQALIAAGAKATRTDYSFMFVNICPTKEVFDAGPANWKWSDADVMLGAIRAAGLSADIILAGTPQWAVDPDGAAMKAPADKRTRSTVWATTPGLFQTFCQYFAARYADQIDYYEVGNEWNLSMPEEFTGEEALRMQQEAYAGLHAGYANACVTPNGWSTTGAWSQHEETADRNPYPAKAMSEHPECFDIWAAHVYRDFTGFADAVDRHLVPMVNGFPEAKRRWINTENGLSSVNGAEPAQSETIWKKMLFAWNRGAVGFNWYNLKATGYFNGSEPGFGLITADFHPRAGYASFAAMSAIFEGLDADGSITSEGDRHILRFKGTNWKNDFTGIVLAGWDKSYGRSEAIATDATKAELSDHMGNRTELAIADGVVTFPVSTKPQALLLTGATTATKTALPTPPTVASGFTGRTWNVGPSDDVQAVLDGASAGDTVEFAAGTYSGAATATQLGGVDSLSRLVVDKRLYLKGAGRDRTIIRGGENVRCLLLTENAAGTLVEGMTLAGGRTVAADVRLGADDYSARCFAQNEDGSYSKVGKCGVNIAACGGGVYFTGVAGEAYFVDMAVDDCSAGYAGGAVCGNVILIGTLVRNCRATLIFGGAVQGSVGAFSSVFVGNGGTPGHQVEPLSTVIGYVDGDGPVTWVNCTEAANFGLGLSQYTSPADLSQREYAKKYRFANCVFFDTGSCRFVSQASEAWNSAMNMNGSLMNNHNNIGGDWGASWPNERHFSGGNKATNSKLGWDQFVSVYADWHLREESMMLDAGDKAFIDSYASFVPEEYRGFDFWGDARVQNGEVDMGACEGARQRGNEITVTCDGGTLVDGCLFMDAGGIDVISGPVGTTVRLSPSYDPTREATGIRIDGVASSAKDYAWTVGEAGSGTDAVTLAPIYLTTWFVDAAAAAGGDGSESRPFRTIQEAVDAAYLNDTILLAEGTYDEGTRAVELGGVESLSRVVIDKFLHLKGAGRDKTVILGGDETRCLYLTADAANSTFEGITLKGGRTIAADLTQTSSDTQYRTWNKVGDSAYTRIAKTGANVAACGGGVYFNAVSGSVRFVDMGVEDCRAGFAGGAVCGNVILIRTLVRDSRADVLYGGAVQGSTGAYSCVFVGNGGTAERATSDFSTVFGYIEGTTKVIGVNCSFLVNLGAGLAQLSDLTSSGSRTYATYYEFYNCAFFDAGARFLSQGTVTWNCVMNINGSMQNNHNNIGGDSGSGHAAERHLSGGNTETNSKFGWNQFVSVYTDWHLREESMLLDAGDKTFIDSKATFVPEEYRGFDFWGDARVQNDEVDMGACEGARQKGNNVKISGVSSPFVDGCVYKNGSGLNYISGPVGGTVLLTVPWDEHRNLIAFSVNGGAAEPAVGRAYAWTVGAADAADATLDLELVYSPDWYVDAVNGNDANDGWTSNTAKRTLTESMRYVVSGDTVHAAPGTYADGERTNDFDNVNRGTDSSGVYRDRIPSRVVIPQGVALVADGDRAETVIKGRWHDGSKRQGLNALRAVYMAAGSRLEGFTVSDGSTREGGGNWEDNCGGSVCAPKYTAADPAIIRNCEIVRGGARSAAGVWGGLIDHCHIHDCAVGSDGTCSFHSRIENSVLIGEARTIVEYHYGIYNSTIASTKTGSDNEMNAAGNYPVANSIIAIPNAPVLKYKSQTDYVTSIVENWYNCIVQFPPEADGKPNRLQIDQTTCSNLITNNANWELILDKATGVLAENSIAIDAGDNSWLDEMTTEGDVIGGQRVYNGKVDIGGYEWNWREKYTEALGHPCATAVLASPEVTLEEDGLHIGNGGSLTIGWSDDNGAAWRAKGRVNVGGTVDVYENGLEWGGFTGAGEFQCEVDSTAADSTLRLDYAGPGDLQMLELRNKIGFKIIFK